MDLFKLSAKLQLDKSEYEQGLDDAESGAYRAGQHIGTGLKAVGTMAAAGFAAATTAVVGLVKQSVSEYAEYEQLLGGVKKLYGTAGMSIDEYAKSVGKSVNEVKDKYAELTKAQDLVLKNAQDAYQTAGMSTQQYMEQATSFSAALINSLGGDTVKAAEQTDVAMRAISDNYNTFGGDMQNIQNAFQGFARGNFLMLDNLRLGYAGSKTGMEQLIADANEYAVSMGQAGDLTIDSFSDIVTAIELVQEKQGIAGTTAREAMSTISGSMGMLKSAWSNLVAGMSDANADVPKLISNVVESAKAYVKNIMPVIKQAATGIVQLVQEVAPLIAQELPPLINELLPMIVDTATTLFNGLIDALPTLLDTIIGMLPKIITDIVNAAIRLLPMLVEVSIKAIMAIAQGLIDALPQLVPAIVQVITQIVTILTQPDTLTQLIMAAVQIMGAIAMGLIEALPMLIQALPQIIENVVTTLLTLAPQISEAAWELFLNLVVGLLKAVPELLAQVPIIILGLLNAFAKGAAQLAKSGKQLVDSVYKGFKEKVDNAKQWGKDLIQNFIDGLLAKWNDLKQTVANIAQSIRDYLGFSEPKLGALSNFHTYAPDMIDLFIQGMQDNKGKLLNAVSDTFDFRDNSVNGYDMEYGTGSGGNVYNININQPVDTADNLARVIREEAQYGLIGGEELAY